MVKNLTKRTTNTVYVPKSDQFTDFMAFQELVHITLHSFAIVISRAIGLRNGMESKSPPSKLQGSDSSFKTRKREPVAYGFLDTFSK